MKRWPYFLLAALAGLASACSSDEEELVCEFIGQTQLAATDWPKFRNDTANTGRTGVPVGKTSVRASRVFPGSSLTVGPIATTPIMGTVWVCSGSLQDCNDPDDCPDGEKCTPQERLYVASNDGQVYVLQRDADTIPLPQIPLLEPILTGGAVTSTPLLGESGALFVGVDTGNVMQFNPDGTVRTASRLGTFVAASLNIWNGDGTVYVGTAGGTYAGVCPNGVLRFAVSGQPITASVAVTPSPSDSSTPLIIVADNSGRVRGFNNGGQVWTFSAAAPIAAAVVVREPEEADEQTVFYVADNEGRVVAGNASDGTANNDFQLFAAHAGIFASPALGEDALYVADGSGTLYAIDPREGGAPLWEWELPLPGTILSSPAVSTAGSTEIVVFGADMEACADDPTQPCDACPAGIECAAGFVFAVSEGEQLWAVSVEDQVGTSSPAIAPDEKIYIGTQGGALYAIEPD